MLGSLGYNNYSNMYNSSYTNASNRYAIPNSNVAYVTPVNTNNTVDSATPFANNSSVRVGMYGASNAGVNAAGVTGLNGSGVVLGTGNVEGTDGVDSAKDAGGTGKVKQTECQTCKNRKYVDGSDESDVSFKAPGHISPGSSYSTVMSHEQEHMANARQKTSGSDASLVSASISLKMAVCPECGRTYVAGGTTNTTISYSKTNPYDQNRKTIEGSFLRGQNVDASV